MVVVQIDLKQELNYMPNDELEDLKQSVALEGETDDSDDTDPAPQEEEGESIDDLKARLAKAEEDRAPLPMVAHSASSAASQIN